jgi:hypothetical protein
VNRIRTAGQLLAAAGIIGAGVFGFAAPAAAATDSVTIDNASSLTIKSSQSLSIQGVAAAYCQSGLSKRSASLSLQGPSGSSSVTQTIKSSGNTPCNKDITMSASIASPKRNGSYLVKLDSHGVEKTAALNVLIAPSRATGFAVSSAGTTASFSWTANPEPDITGYQVTSGSGSTVATTGTDACSGSSCATSVDLGSGVAGKTEKFAVRAVRCGLSCSDAVVGPSSSTASTTFPKATPSPTPTPTPTTTPTGGGGNGGNGGNGGGGGIILSAGNGGGHGSHTGGAGGGGGGAGSKHQPKNHLPSFHIGSLPVIHLPSLPGLETKVKPLVLGKPGGKIHYPAPKLATTTKQKPRTTTQAIRHDIVTGLKMPPLWRGVAAAAILLLIAMHLRAWAARVDLS